MEDYNHFQIPKLHIVKPQKMKVRNALLIHNPKGEPTKPQAVRWDGRRKRYIFDLGYSTKTMVRALRELQWEQRARQNQERSPRCIVKRWNRSYKRDQAIAEIFTIADWVWPGMRLENPAMFVRNFLRSMVDSQHMRRRM